MNAGGTSVVVAVNPHDHAMGPVLDAWADQREAGALEVLVVDTGARPDLGAAVAEHRERRPGTPVRCIDAPGAGRAAANNAGVRASRGDLVAFVADDFRPSPGLVAAHRRFHAYAAASAVGVGPAYFEHGHREDPFRRWMEDGGMGFGVAFTLAAIDWRGDYFYVGNASMRRATFERIGAFDERYRHDLFDDWEFSLRLQAAGLATSLVPRAYAWHDHEYSIETRIEATERLGEAARQFEATGPGPRPWAPFTELPAEALERELAALPPENGDEPIGERKHRWKLRLTLAFLRGYGAAPVTPPPSAGSAARS